MVIFTMIVSSCFLLFALGFLCISLPLLSSFLPFSQNLGFATCYLNIAEMVNSLCKNEIVKLKAVFRDLLLYGYIDDAAYIFQHGEFPVFYWKKSSLIKTNSILLITLLLHTYILCFLLLKFLRGRKELHLKNTRQRLSFEDTVLSERIYWHVHHK